MEKNIITQIMHKLLKSLSILALAAVILPQLAGAQSRGIYGNDDRLDYFEASPSMRQLADSVVSLWPSKHIEFENGQARLFTIGFGVALNLCPGEKFREQPLGSFCSGTLVGEDLVMTAGHCVKNADFCKNIKFVFGFEVKAEGVMPDSVPAGDVYGCGKLLGGEHVVNGADWALVRLDRKVEGRKPLPVNRSNDLKAGEKIFVIGHPVGLPVKVAGDASVRNTDPMAFFMTDLDTFGGNSGSPVFNARTNMIEGIMVRGGTDFVTTSAGCKVQYKVGQGGGKGEAVTKISKVHEYIPKIGSPKAAQLEIRDMRMVPVSMENEELARKIKF